MDFVAALTGPEVIALVALGGANVILCMLAAFMKGTFDLQESGKFVSSRVVPLIAYLVIAVLATMADGYTAIAGVVYAGLVLLYGTGILKALKSLFPGLKFPLIK